MNLSLLSDSDSDSSEEEEEDMIDIWIARYYQRRVAHFRKKTRNPRKFQLVRTSPLVAGPGL